MFEDMTSARMVVTLRSEIRRPVWVLLAFWVASALAVSQWLESPWLLAFAAGGVAGSALLLAWVMWPRPGDLVRLVLDRSLKTLYWAHRGGEPEELPFGALRAVAIESSDHPRYAVLWVVDTSGRWVSLGQGTRVDMEHFAREMAEVMTLPLWYRDPVSDAGNAPPAPPRVG